MTLEKLLSSYEFLITYKPLADEVSVDVPSGIEAFALPADASQDPAQVAHEAARRSNGRRTALILPGTSFDASGTRHGRGAGWYDRFLRAAPNEWLRIGVCAARQWSAQPLTRKPWDEPVDYVLVYKDGNAELIETKAR